jgi:hypothetical protein
MSKASPKAEQLINRLVIEAIRECEYNNKPALDEAKEALRRYIRQLENDLPDE